MMKNIFTVALVLSITFAFTAYKTVFAQENIITQSSDIAEGEQTLLGNGNVIMPAPQLSENNQEITSDVPEENILDTFDDEQMPPRPTPSNDLGDEAGDGNELFMDPVETGINRSTTFDPNTFPSLLFTYWEQMSIIDAKNSVGETRPPTEQELYEDMTAPSDSYDGGAVPEQPPVSPGIRTIQLGGIAYQEKGKWTIWLNGQRVTPGSLPKEIMDLKVYENYIEMKWLDEYKNQILPIRLRPHQRFNIDSKIFLPG